MAIRETILYKFGIKKAFCYYFIRRRVIEKYVLDSSLEISSFARRSASSLTIITESTETHRFCNYR